MKDLLTILEVASIAAIVCFFIMFSYVAELRRTNRQMLRIVTKYAVKNGLLTDVKCSKCGHDFKTLEFDKVVCPKCKAMNQIDAEKV